MIEYNTQRGSRSRIAPLFGDGEILLSLFKTDFWMRLISKKGWAGIVFFKTFFALTISMITFSTIAILRYRFGTRTVGLVFSFMTLLLLLALNSSWLYWFAKPFFPLTGAFFPFFVDTQFWQEFLLTNIYSKALFYYSCVYSAFSLVHVVAIYTGFGNTSDPSKRGDSIIYRLFFRYSKLTEFTIQARLEPLIIALTALCLWKFSGDTLFASFLALSALCLFIQESLDRAHQNRLRLPE